MSTPILVLGLPRSGTSAVAGILHHLGVYMGSELGQPNLWNAKGSFEDIPFALQCEAAIGRIKDFWRLPPSNFDAPAVWSTLDTSTPLRGVKNSHLPFLFRSAPISARLVVTSRGFGDVYSSFSAPHCHANLGIENARKCLAYCQGALSDALSGRAYYTVNYDTLLSNTEYEITQLAQYLDLRVTSDALSFIDPCFRRFGG